MMMPIMKKQKSRFAPPEFPPATEGLPASLKRQKATMDLKALIPPQNNNGSDKDKEVPKNNSYGSDNSSVELMVDSDEEKELMGEETVTVPLRPKNVKAVPIHPAVPKQATATVIKDKSETTVAAEIPTKKPRKQQRPNKLEIGGSKVATEPTKLKAVPPPSVPPQQQQAGPEKSVPTIKKINSGPAVSAPTTIRKGERPTCFPIVMFTLCEECKGEILYYNRMYTPNGKQLVHIPMCATCVVRNANLCKLFE